MGKDQVMEKPDPAVRDALDHVRAATQELHKAISDTLAKRASATKAEIEGLIQKAKEAADSAKSAVRAQQGTVKQQLTEAVEKLDAAHKDAAESLKSSGEALQASLTKALADARAAVQKVSEAVAARRSAQAAKAPPAKQAS